MSRLTPGRRPRAPLSRRAFGRLALAALGTLVATTSGGVALPTAAAQAAARRTLTAPAASLQRTARTGALGPDGYNWAQARNPLVDRYGKIIAFVQSAQSIQPVVSNDGGATWSDPTMIGWQGSDGGAGEVGTRCALAYDSVNDTVHTLFVHYETADAGSYYRRFRVNRDGARNVTGLTRDGAINCILERQDVGEPTCGTAHPVIFWLNDDPVGRPHGYLVCLWGVNEDTGTAVSASVRGAMLVLSNSPADNGVANWRGLRGESTIVATSAQRPQVPCTEVFYKNPGHHQPYQAHPAAIRLPTDAPTHPGDLCVVVAVAGEGLYYRRLTWSAATGDWRGEMSALAAGPTFARARTSDRGYNGKQELVPEPSYDAAHDRLWVGLSEWVSDADGDGWSVTYVDNRADAFRDGPPTVAYAAGASRCSADTFVTGDAWWDADAGCLLVAYTSLPDHLVSVVPLGADEARLDWPLTIFTTQPFDIPVFLRAAWPGGRRMIIGRGFNAEAASTPPSYTGGPYDGWALTFVVA